MRHWRWSIPGELLKVGFCTRVIGVNDAVLENAWPWQRFYGRRRGNAECLFSPELIRRLADRHLGVGFDQLLVVEPPYDPELDFHYRISMLMAVKWRSAATVRALPVLCV